MIADNDNSKETQIEISLNIEKKHKMLRTLNQKSNYQNQYPKEESLRKICPYSKLFWSLFSRIRT